MQGVISASEELTNLDRRYFGLCEVRQNWERVWLDKSIILYYDAQKIVKILDYTYGYNEYDSDIVTRERSVLLPRTTRGKEQRLTSSRLLKIKGSGIRFSASYQGGGIQVSDNTRDRLFIKSYNEEGMISCWADVRKWVDKYVKESYPDHFEWLRSQLRSPKLRVNVKKGDIIAFSVSRYEYAFASVISGDYISEHRLMDGEVYKSNFFGKPVLILPYTVISDSPDTDLDDLIRSTPMRPIEIMAQALCTGEFPVVGFRAVPDTTLWDIDLSSLNKYFTIPLSKTDILRKSHDF